jgi:hypothetical protein
MTFNNNVNSMPGVNPPGAKTWQQLLAEDPRFKANNPLAAIQYSSYPFQYENDSVYRAGRTTREGLKSFIRNSKIHDAINQGPIPGALLVGALAAAAGGLGGSLANVGLNAYSKVTGDRKKRIDAVKMALMLGLIGAGVGAYSGWMNKSMNESMNKSSGFRNSANWRDNDPYQIIMEALRDSRTLSFNEQAQLMRGVSQLSPMQAAALARQIKTAAGAAIGALVARFLAGAGLGGMVLGGLIGGTLAKSLMVRRDSFGRAY